METPSSLTDEQQQERRVIRPPRRTQPALPVANGETSPRLVVVEPRALPPEQSTAHAVRAPGELMHGRESKSQYIRVMTTEPRDGFRRRSGGVLEATQEASRPRSGVAALAGQVKGVLVGAPLSSTRLAHERLSKLKALAVFSSDAVSSSAYAGGEIIIILMLAGTGHLGLAIPIAAAIVALLAIVAVSYQQTIRAYPNGGGAYIVAHENLGNLPGQAAAGALLVDYILTVSVSVAAGVAAIIAAVPDSAGYRIPMGIAAIVVVTLLNLRGVRDSGTIFAIPTYAFILMGVALLVVGAIRYLTGGIQPVAYEEMHAASQGLGLFLILRAFSSGCAALTGVEAISNGVPAFKPPEARNASVTLAWMAVILGTLFFGTVLLANQYGLREEPGQTIVSQLGREVFGGENLFYFMWQGATAMILLLAANTAFADFPRLASLLAKDGYMPRQFAFRGDRLAYSNGIIVLGAAAIAILTGFGGDVTRLIPLYAIGVFVSFTLSQSGMVRHWLRERGRGWRRSLAINATGAVATVIVALIITLTKFTHGAWMSLLIGVVLVLCFRLIRRHYDAVDREMALPTLDEPLVLTGHAPTVIVPVRSLNKPVVRALAYACSIATRVTAVHITDEPRAADGLRRQWERWAGDVPLVVIESPYRSFTEPLLRYMDLIESRNPGTTITVVLPEFVPRRWWQTLLHNQDALRLKAALLFRRDTVVVDVPQHLGM